MPIFRSGLQARLLALLFLHPEREWPGADLARHVSAPRQTVNDEMRRLEAAGLVVASETGTAKLYRAAASGQRPMPYQPELLLSDNEPVNPRRFFRLGRFRLRKYESGLDLVLRVKDNETLADAVEHEMDQLGIADFHVAGYSLGARVSLELATRGRIRDESTVGTSTTAAIPRRDSAARFARH